MLEFTLWNYKLEPLIWTKIIESIFPIHERVLIAMLSIFGIWGSLAGLSWHLKAEQVLDMKKRISKSALYVFCLSCKILFFLQIRTIYLGQLRRGMIHCQPFCWTAYFDKLEGVELSIVIVVQHQMGFQVRPRSFHFRFCCSFPIYFVCKSACSEFSKWQKRNIINIYTTLTFIIYTN